MRWLVSLAAAIIIIGSASVVQINAQAAVSNAQIAFDSFSATYHLSRDATGGSLLTTEEVILADFPSNASYYGISRTIPKTYQGRSVQVKILSIQDASGQDIKYKTSADSRGNLIVVTGDPAITLYGFQTYRINYQTRDVVDLGGNNDQLLLDVNGRGWSQTFSSVIGIIHIPKSFSSSLIGQPSCYIGYQATTSANCSISSQTNQNETIITVRSSGKVGPAHSLVAKLNFKPASFRHSDSGLSAKWTIAAVLAALAALMSVFWYSRRR